MVTLAGVQTCLLFPLLLHSAHIAPALMQRIVCAGACSVHEVSVAHQPGRNLAVKRVDWSTHEQRVNIAKVGDHCCKQRYQQ
jgi:hypothetical protein